MLNFFKALISRDDIMIGLAIGALVSAMFYKLWPGVYPEGWEGEGEKIKKACCSGASLSQLKSGPGSPGLSRHPCIRG